MRVVSLGSGSSGNALLVEAGPQGRTRLLVDAGLSARVITARLRSVGVHPSQLQGVLVTHEHSDHVLGLPVLMKQHAIPVIADPRTYKAIEEGIALGTWRTDSGRLVLTGVEQDAVLRETVTITYDSAPGVDVHEVYKEESVLRESEDVVQDLCPLSVLSPVKTIALPVGSRWMIGDIEVTSFPISHDAVAPCGYLLRAGGCRVCLVTDSGEVTPAMLEMMQHADLLILEANHDRERLLRGPYPRSLKQRILSSNGHLSNDQAADAVLRTWRSGDVRWLWLAHLSRTNNSPALALQSIRVRLRAANANLAQIHISALPPTMGQVWDSTQLWHTPSLWDMEAL